MWVISSTKSFTTSYIIISIVWLIEQNLTVVIQRDLNIKVAPFGWEPNKALNLISILYMSPSLISYNQTCGYRHRAYPFFHSSFPTYINGPSETSSDDTTHSPAHKGARWGARSCLSLCKADTAATSCSHFPLQHSPLPLPPVLSLSLSLLLI